MPKCPAAVRVFGCSGPLKIFISSTLDLADNQIINLQYRINQAFGWMLYDTSLPQFQSGQLYRVICKAGDIQDRYQDANLLIFEQIGK